MFVAVVCEFSSDDTRSEIYKLLKQYGFERIYRDVFESVSIKATILARLKRDIDRITDFYDRVRLYQFPLDDTFVITTLHDKKWRKTVVRS